MFSCCISFIARYLERAEALTERERKRLLRERERAEVLAKRERESGSARGEFTIQ